LAKKEKNKGKIYSQNTSDSQSKGKKILPKAEAKFTPSKVQPEEMKK
jgi:hypothetical protein